MPSVGGWTLILTAQCVYHDSSRQMADFADIQELQNFLGDIERLEKLSEGVKLEAKQPADQAIKV